MRVLAQLRKPATLLILGAVILATIWIGNTWSRSSYGLVLRAMGATSDGVVLGTPQGVLSDEWGQTTPMTQATVNNGLERYNKTSYYGEDLRIVYSLPVRDWGMLFKPDKWLYPVVNAAYAFSFQALFYLAAFFAGYTLLFRRLGATALEGVAFSAVLFFTAFVQFWWNLYSPTLALFPWVILALDIANPWLRFAVLVWVSTAWMLGQFYPPLIITMAYVGAAIVLHLHARRSQWGRLGFAAIAAACACGLAVFYLRDTLTATWATQYPGQRRVDGGGLPGTALVQVLWPNAYLRDFKTTFPPETYPDYMVGTYFTLMTVVFLDYARAFENSIPANTRRYMLALAVAIGILLAWEVLPIPRQWVMWTGLPFTLPTRSGYASGLGTLFLCVAAVAVFGLRFSLSRFAVFTAIVLLGWGVTKSGAESSLWSRVWPDLFIIPIAAVVLVPLDQIRRNGALVVSLACALWGAVAFGGFNPLQNAWPIFNRPTTTVSELLDFRVKHAPGGVLADNKFGAILNGWGYRSVAHVLFVPPMDKWHALFPDFDPVTFDAIFNRYCHVIPIESAIPKGLPSYVTGVPRALFEKDLWRAEVRRGERPDYTVADGRIDDRVMDDGRVVLRGWAPLRGLSLEQRLTVYTDVDAVVIHVDRIPRDDVARVRGDRELRLSGFAITIESADRARDLRRERFCVVAQDGQNAPRVLVSEDGYDCKR